MPSAVQFAIAGPPEVSAVTGGPVAPKGSRAATRSTAEFNARAVPKLLCAMVDVDAAGQFWNLSLTCEAVHVSPSTDGAYLPRCEL